MKMLRWFCGLLVAIVICGCNDEDSHDTVTINGENQPYQNSGGGGGDGYSTYQGGGNNYVNQVTEAYITLNNQSSTPITFTVNGQTQTVSPGYSGTWAYQGSARMSTTISGSAWNYTWPDGQNHTLVATDNGAPGGFDLN